jgi:hypothetical protein
MRSEVDSFIRCVLTILLGILYYGCFNFICFVICVCFCNMYILTFSAFYLCTYLYCFVVILLFCVFLFVCTSVALLPPGESPIAVNNKKNNNNNYYYYYIIKMFANLNSTGR